MRVFYINLNRIGPDSYKKIEYLKKQIKNQQLDICMMSSPNRKQTKRSESIIKTKLQVGSNKTIIVTIDSRETKKTKEEWLLGENLSLFGGK